jgi:ABC-2 type transport system ATP-binding protein
MAEVRIEARALTKRYGSVAAVDGLSFTIAPGKVTGFVGPNGAGKSTTMRMMLGLDRADSGTALIGGQPYARLRDPLRVVGALLDAEAVHPGRRARDHLLWLARYSGVSATRVDQVLELVGLASVSRQRTGGFSLGMRQRLGIAAALLGDPPVLILDEPVNGLDPDGVQWIRRLLRSMAAEGRTVLVSSHLMGELQDTADHLIVIGRGRLLADTGVDELLAATSGGQVAVRTTHRSEAIRELTAAGATVAVIGSDRLAVSGLLTEQVIALLTRHGLPFAEVYQHQASLEEAYMDLTRNATDFTSTPQPDQTVES